MDTDTGVMIQMTFGIGADHLLTHAGFSSKTVMQPSGVIRDTWMSLGQIILGCSFEMKMVPGGMMVQGFPHFPRCPALSPRTSILQEVNLV
jgi:hypothetical protein